MVIRSMFAPSFSLRLFLSHYRSRSRNWIRAQHTNSLAIAFAFATATPDPPNERSIPPGTIVRSLRLARGCAFAGRCGQTKIKRGRHNPLSIELDALALYALHSDTICCGDWMGITLHNVHQTLYHYMYTLFVRLCVCHLNYTAHPTIFVIVQRSSTSVCVNHCRGWFVQLAESNIVNLIQSDSLAVFVCLRAWTRAFVCLCRLN